MTKFRFAPLVLFAAFVLTGVYADVDGRWAVAAVLMAVLVARTLWCRREAASALAAEQDGPLPPRVYLWLLALVLAGFCLRVCAVFAFKAAPLGDATGFWREISLWSQGRFCLTKSYTLVAFYGLLALVFGKSLLLVGLVNAVLGCVQIYLAFAVARRVFRRDAAGLFAAAVTALNPISIYATQLVMSETLFATLMLAFFALWLRTMDAWHAEGRTSRLAVPAAAGLVGSLAFYCRGNGLFLIAAAVVAMTCTWASGRDRRVFLLRVCLPFFVGVGAVAAPVMVANRAVYGHWVAGSSDDSIWPLLAGSDVATEGRWSPNNYVRYRARLKELTGREDFSLYRDTHLLAPYIKEEILGRWKADPKAQVRLCLLKYRKLWSSGGEWAYGNRTMDASFVKEVQTWHFDLLHTSMRRVKELLAVAALACFALFPFMRGGGASVVVATFAFLAFNVVNHLFCEEKPRYCYLLWTLLPVWAAGIVVLIGRRGRPSDQQRELQPPSGTAAQSGRDYVQF